MKLVVLQFNVMACRCKMMQIIAMPLWQFAMASVMPVRAQVPGWCRTRQTKYLLTVAFSRNMFMILLYTFIIFPVLDDLVLIVWEFLQ